MHAPDLRAPARHGVLLVSAALAAAAYAPAPGHAMRDTEQRLLTDLLAAPAFRQRVPPHSAVTRLEFTGAVFPGDLVYGADPREIAVVPRALKNDLAVNCDRSQTRISGGTIGGAYTNSSSFTTTSGWEIGTSLSFTANWPAASVNWTISGSVSGSTADMTGASETWEVSQTWSAPLLPRTEMDVQMQVIQQKVDGQPYSMDLELRGKADIHYRPVLGWVDSTGGVPANAIIGGRETSPTSGRERRLPICRAGHRGAWHPGKVVAGNCNITWGGVEYEKRRFQVLTGDSRLYSWRAYSGGGTDPENGVVAGTESRDDKHGGKLYVCRADYRGGTHPGKLVINDCMIGYGGSEIQIGNYEILIFDKNQDRSFPINIEDYLPLERRSFRIEGQFEGVAALSTLTLYSDSRPVSEARCPSAPVPAVRAAASERRAPLGFEAQRVEAAEVARAARAPEVALAPLARGTPLVETTVPSADPAAAAPAAHLVSRLLRLERPNLFGADVLVMQQALNAAGWPMRADGFFGPVTDRALRHFQRANGLSADGIFGPRSQARMGL